MFIEEYFVVYPEGDVQKIPFKLRINQLVDVNGSPLSLPLPTCKMIVFRVIRVQTKDFKGGSETFHYLELMSAPELVEFCE